MSPEVLAQVAALDVLLRDIVVAIEFANLVNLNDIGLSQSRGCLGFLAKPLDV